MYIGVEKSDHLGILLTKSTREARTTARTTKKRIYKNFYKETFKEDITKAKLNGRFAGVIINATDPDEAFEMFERGYENVLDKQAFPPGQLSSQAWVRDMISVKL